MNQWKRQFIKKLFHYDAYHMDIEGAFMVKHPHVPQSLYKFRAFVDSHKNAFLEGELWTASADKLNDPNECGAFFRPDAMIVDDLSREEFEGRIANLKEDSSRLAQYYDAEIKRPTTSGQFMAKIIDEVFEANPHEHEKEIRQALNTVFESANQKIVNTMSAGMRPHVGILSLSETYHSTLMWSHYSDAHKGFVIEYDFGSLGYADLRRRLCCPVFYSTKQRDITNHLRKRSGTRGFNNLFGQYISLIKEADWSYEKEWRIFTMFGSSLATRPLQMPKPKSVILGRSCSEENHNWMVRACAEKGITLNKISASDRSGNFAVERVLEAQ